MAHPIFNTPQILGLIFDQLQLDGGDLRTVMPVSRKFFLCSVPLRWKFVGDCERLRRLAFTDDILKKRVNKWINKIQPLDQELLRRISLYTTHIKHLKDTFEQRRKQGHWIMLLKAIPTRPILPNLRVLTLEDFHITDMLPTFLDALLSPTLVTIQAPGYTDGTSLPILSLERMTKISESCPNIQSIELYSAIRHSVIRRTPATVSLPSHKPLTTVGQLQNLRSLSAGMEILFPEMLPLLGSLPRLESLEICVPSDTEEDDLEHPFALPPGSFSALKHLGLYCESPDLLLEVWKKLPFTRCLASIFIKTDGFLADEGTLPNLLCDICSQSPGIIDLRFDATRELSGGMQTELFTVPAVANLKSCRSLKRLTILNSRSQILLPDDFEQLAIALADLEYLDLSDCYLPFEGLACIAKCMQALEYLAVNFSFQNWPQENEIPPGLPASSSVIHLKSQFTVPTWYGGNFPGNTYTFVLPIILQRLWPNGVHCGFTHSAETSIECKQPERDALSLINSTIVGLCAPAKFNAPNPYLAAQWKYVDNNNGGGSWSLNHIMLE